MAKSSKERKHRNRTADFWDAALSSWNGAENWEAVRLVHGPAAAQDLDRWRKSYKGVGRGRVDLSCYPDPFTGDLRGAQVEPRLVVLGLNPGIAYQGLQGPEGIWTKRIRSSSYSRCFDRSPPDDQEWKTSHGRESKYWKALSTFGQQWHGKDFSWREILNFELYPWHSSSLTAGLHTPPDLVEHYILEPISEIDVPHVFAFGRPWLAVARGLNFREIRRFGKEVGGSEFPGMSCKGWNVVLFASKILDATLVVSWQSGYAGPPGRARVETLRNILRV